MNLDSRVEGFDEGQQRLDASSKSPHCPLPPHPSRVTGH